MLKPGGKVLIFDANWHRRFIDEQCRIEYERDEEEYEKITGNKAPFYSEEMIHYRKSMPLCSEIRPQWDICALLETNFKKLYCDVTIGDTVYDDMQKLRYRSVPMFMIIVEK